MHRNQNMETGYMTATVTLGILLTTVQQLIKILNEPKDPHNILEAKKNPRRAIGRKTTLVAMCQLNKGLSTTFFSMVKTGGIENVEDFLKTSPYDTASKKM